MLTPEQAEQKRQKKRQQAEPTDHTCTCGEGHLIRRPAKKKDAQGNTRYWYGCSRFPECRNTFPEVDGVPKTQKAKELGS